MASTLEILKRLTHRKVDFVLVGGMAGIAHGSSHVTEDLDVCASFDRENMERLFLAIGDLNPRWRTPPKFPLLQDDAGKLASFKNLYIVTDLGLLDVLSEITGIGPFDEVKRQSDELKIADAFCRVLNLQALITSKRSLARPEDLRVAKELEAIRDKIKC